MWNLKKAGVNCNLPKEHWLITLSDLYYGAYRNFTTKFQKLQNGGSVEVEAHFRGLHYTKTSKFGLENHSQCYINLRFENAIYLQRT